MRDCASAVVEAVPSPQVQASPRLLVPEHSAPPPPQTKDHSLQWTPTPTQTANESPDSPSHPQNSPPESSDRSDSPSRHNCNPPDPISCQCCRSSRPGSSDP